MCTNIYENSYIRVEVEESEIPWLKVFAKAERREFSDCSIDEKNAIFTAIDVIEKEMLAYYKPTKINIASFGNYLPQVHWHVMSRFSEDSYFPEPMWGQKQRDTVLTLPSFEIFCTKVTTRLEQLLGA